jgi:hypothetical protein
MKNGAFYAKAPFLFAKINKNVTILGSFCGCAAGN